MLGRTAPVAVPFAGAVLAAIGIARAQVYSATVLYSLNPPAGFSSATPAGSPATAAEGQVVGSAWGSNDHALFWAPATGGVDLGENLPAGAIKSYAAATDGSQQGGYAEGSGGVYTDQAVLWSSSSNSLVNLNPTAFSGINASELQGLAPGQQVGYATGPGINYSNHAMVWNGSAGSAVDLNPTTLGIAASMAMATDAQQQVGFGSGGSPNAQPHALLWTGTASSAVDLNPTSLGVDASEALAVDAGQQVGDGKGTSTGNLTHALLWNGSAASAVDLNPTAIPGIQSSEAQGTNGTDQVGFGSGTSTGNQKHAMLWTGTANSAVDLQSLLPASGTWTSSYASSIEASGDVFGIANGTYNGTTGNFAVEWTSSISTGVIDIGRGSEDLAGATLATVTAQVHSGFNGGNWNGTTGIISSVAAADTSHLTAVGVIQNNQGGSPLYSASKPFEGTSPAGSDILVKFTYYGDANLDGTVDSADYTLIDAAYLYNKTAANPLTGWFNGDFNYDGVINGSDYTLIDNAFNTQGGQITTQLAHITTEIASVPEPVGITLLTSLLPLLRRRR